MIQDNAIGKTSLMVIL